MQAQKLPHIWFFLLINTKSGGGWGKRYLQLSKQQFSFQYKKQSIINVIFIDLFNQQKKAFQLAKARKLQSNKINDIRIIICGGDGTILWGIQQCYNAGLNMDKISFSCIPIGTGNDFSRTLGWGRHPINIEEGNILELKKRIIQWTNSKITKYDIWQIQISVNEKGQIYTIKDKQDFLIDSKVFKKGFTNYVGLGIDGRVSFTFQKHRTSRKYCNMVVLTYLGLCHFMCQKLPELSQGEGLQSFQQYQPNNSTNYSNSDKQINLEQSMTEYLNGPNSNRQSKQVKMKKGFKGMIIQNSTSYMAGALNIWNTKKIGCKQQVNFINQQIGDGKLEFIGYTHQWPMSLENFQIRTGSRVAQGQGPFVMRFNQEAFQNDYCIQIDGEGYMFRGLKQIIIRRHEKIPNINVMAKDNKK